MIEDNMAGSQRYFFTSRKDTMYELLDNYGEMHAGMNIEPIEEGYDWIKVIHRGKAMYIPKNLLKSEFDVDN